MTKKKDKKNTHPLYAEEYWKIKALFEDDNTVTVSDINDKERSCIITCDDELKAFYLEAAIHTKELCVIVDAVKPLTINENIASYILKDNPHFNSFYENEDGMNHYKAVMMNPDCISWFSDDMFSPTSNTAITAADLAKEIIGQNINYQTTFVKE